MPQVKYIANGTKTDSIRGVGLLWEPGQVRNVTAEVAERLLAHADTWAKLESKKESAQLEPAQEEQEGEVGLSQEERPVEEPLPVIDFHAMDKSALIDFALTKYNEKLDKRQNEEALRHRVIALFGQHEMDNEAL